MRLGLIPVGCAAIIVAAMVGVAMLYGDFDAFLEIDRVEYMVPVPRDLSLPVLSSG